MHFMRCLITLILNYLYVQFQYLDPVEDIKQRFLRFNNVSTQVGPDRTGPPSYTLGKSCFLNRPFVLHLFFYVVQISCLFFGMQYHHLGKVNFKTLLTSPYIGNHQIYLPDLWAQIDLCFYGGIVASFCAYASLATNPIHEERYKMTLKTNGRLAIRQKELSKADSEKICQFRQRFKTPIFATIVFFDLLAMVYFYTVLLYQGVYRVHLFDALFWLVLFPRLMFDTIFGLFGIMVFVIFTSKYLQIRLQTILSEMIKLNWKIVENSNNMGYRFRSAWYEYIKQNRRLLTLCSDMQEYTHFWSPYLSIMLPFYVWVQAYLVYICFFIDSIPFVQKYLFIYSVIEFDLVLFLLIDQCARVVNLSQRILSENRRFFINIQQQSRSDVRKPMTRNLHLAESLQINRRLHCYAFRLFGNYRITSKTFHLVISYMSIFFLMVVKSQKIKKIQIFD